MKNKTKMFFSVIVASLLALGTPVLAENVTGDAQVGNVAPTVDLIDVPSNVVLTGGEMNNTFEVTCQYTDNNNISDINKTTSYLAFGDGSDYNKTFSNALVSYSGNTTTENATVTVENVPYYRSPASYGVDCYVRDNQGASDSLTETTSIASLEASDVNVTGVDFGTHLPGETGISDVFKVENMGNVKLNSSWEGTDFSGPSGSFGVDNAYIDSGLAAGQMALLTSPQYYGQMDAEIDGGTTGRLYEPNFGLTIPSTSPGSYNNTMTHIVTAA